MIPSDTIIFSLWDKYALSEKKRIHVTLVARVADFLARKYIESEPETPIDLALLRASALLHDIDNGIITRPGEVHPDAAVRLIQEEGFFDIAEIVKTHSLYAILDAGIMPKRWEEKVLYLSDKMVKYEILTVDKRFALWRSEKLPKAALEKLIACYPLVKKLEKEIFMHIGMQPEDVCSILGL